MPLRSTVPAMPSRSNCSAAACCASATARFEACTRISPRERASAAPIAAAIRSWSTCARKLFSRIVAPSLPASGRAATAEASATARRAAAAVAAPAAGAARAEVGQDDPEQDRALDQPRLRQRLAALEAAPDGEEAEHRRRRRGEREDQESEPDGQATGLVRGDAPDR